MARLKSYKTDKGPKKVRAKKNPLRMDEKYTGTEPEWTEGLKFASPEEYNLAMHKAFNYYNYFYVTKDLKKDVVEYLQLNTKLTAKQVTTYKRSPDHLTTMTICSLARMILRGFPVNDKHREIILARVKDAIAQTDPTVLVVEKKKTKKKDDSAAGLLRTIQDRMLAQARSYASEIDGDMDNVFTKQESQFDLYQFLVEKQVTKPVASKMRAMYESAYDEIKESKSKKGDKQLIEGYEFLKGKQLKDVMNWFEKLFHDFDNYIKHKNLNRKPRKKKAVSVDKVVSKLKYLKEYKDLRLVSIRPTDIIGSEQLWIFNVKTRKLGRYFAEDHNQLSIKGSTVLGFDPSKSYSKTVRKPAEKLPELLKAGKVNLRKFLDEIRATTVKLTGRINKDTILLRVE